MSGAHPFQITSISGAVFSDDRRYRHWLWRIWTQSLPILIIVMFNPSNANAKKDDPTISRCCQFARAWGYGGILAINLFDLIDSDPKAIRYLLSRNPRKARGDSQDAAWKFALQIAEDQETPIMVAWGNLADEADLEKAREALKGHRLICLGRTASGMPIHPAARGKSRPANDQKPITYWLD